MSEQDLRAASQAWVDAFRAGDATALGALYTEDAQLLPPDENPIVGQEAISGFWGSFIADIGADSLNAVNIQDALVDGDLGTLVGIVDAQIGGESARIKYIEVWRRGPEGWRMFRDIWNNSP